MCSAVNTSIAASIDKFLSIIAGFGPNTQGEAPRPDGPPAERKTRPFRVVVDDNPSELAIQRKQKFIPAMPFYPRFEPAYAGGCVPDRLTSPRTRRGIRATVRDSAPKVKVLDQNNGRIRTQQGKLNRTIQFIIYYECSRLRRRWQPNLAILLRRFLDCDFGANR